MKRALSILLCLAVLLAFAGCEDKKSSIEGETGSMSDDDKAGNRSSVIRDIDPGEPKYANRFLDGDQVMEVDLDQLPQYFSESDRKKWMSGEGISAMGVFCETLSFDMVKVGASKTDENGTLYWAYRDFKDGETHRLDQKNRFGIASGVNSVIMDGQDCYVSYNYGEDRDAPDNQLFKVSARDDTVTKVKDIESDSLFVDLIKLDRDQFLYNVYEKTDDRKNVTASVYKYNCKTGEESLLFSESYADKFEEDGTAEGLQFYHFCATDGDIYAFFAYYEGEKKHFLLRVYDENGQVEKEIDADAVSRFLGNYEVMNMQVCGDILYIRAFGDGWGGSLYRIVDDHLQAELERSEAVGTNHCKFLAPDGNQQIWSSGECGYLVFYDSNDTESFCVYNSATDRVTRFVVSGSEEYPDIQSIWIDEYGNVRLTMTNSMYDFGYGYYLKNSIIRQNIA